MIAERHKALSLLGKSSWQEVVEEKLRLELAEAQVENERLQAELTTLRAERPPQDEALHLQELLEIKSRTVYRLMAGFKELAAFIEDDEPTNVDHIRSLVSVLKFTIEKLRAERPDPQNLIAAVHEYDDYVRKYLYPKAPTKEHTKRIGQLHHAITKAARAYVDPLKET